MTNHEGVLSVYETASDDYCLTNLHFTIGLLIAPPRSSVFLRNAFGTPHATICGIEQRQGQTLHLMWENLTNSQYFVTPYYPILDRAVKFGVSWQFLD